MLLDVAPRRTSTSERRPRPHGGKGALSPDSKQHFFPNGSGQIRFTFVCSKSNLRSKKQELILIFSLSESRASRIVWLLEELELDYEIKVYKRNLDYLAPDELKKVWPTGMSPVLQIFKNGSTEPYTVAESGHIVGYVIRHYDPKGKLTPTSEDDKELMDYYLHFTEGSLQPHLVSMLVGHMATLRAPWPAGGLVKYITGKMNSEFYLKRLLTNLEFLDKQLEKKGGGYFVGDKLSGADIILDFPINENIFGNPERLEKVAKNLNPKKKFPNLYKWHMLTYKQASRVAAAEKAEAKL